MVDTQPSASAILPQNEPKLQLLDQDHQHQQQLKQQEEQSAMAMYQNQHYHHHHSHVHGHEQQLADITREFLMQNMTGSPTGINQGPQALLQLQHQHATGGATDVALEEELNIYDYIHAKQEDEDEHDGDDHGHAHDHQSDPASLSASALLVKDNSATTGNSSTSANATATDPFSHHNSLDHPHAVRPSPASSASTASSPVLSAHSASSPTFSALSAASPSSPSSVSSYVQHDDFSASAISATSLAGETLGQGGDQTQQDLTILRAIKQESLDSTALLDHHHSSYMDTSMDLYGNGDASLLTSQADLMPPPPQDLFRMLMEELQTQASVQREKFFTATTGSGTGMDSVEFLFNGPQTQAQAQEQEQEQAQTQVKPVPHFVAETSASNNMLSTDSDSCLEDQAAGGFCPIDEPSPMQVDDLSAPPDAIRIRPPAIAVAVPASSGHLQDVAMETAEPEDDLPPSPTHSSSSSGSDTPSGLTSPSYGHTMTTSPPSPKSAVVRVAFTRIANQYSKANATNTGAMAGQSSLVSPIADVSFQSVYEQFGSRRRTADTVKEESSDPSIISVQSATRKKRKLSRDVENQSHDGSPRLYALPSPPSSVRTTPPLQPMTMDASSSVDSLMLPPACSMEMEGSVLDLGAEPVTPTSPAPLKVEAAMESVAGANVSDQPEAPSSPESTTDIKKTSNANNKRPWTTEEEKLLLKLVDDRTAIKDIAETLNRSVHSVRSRRQVLTDPGFVKGNGHAQPRRSKPDPSSKLPTYSQMAFLSLARLPELQGTLNDVASMVEKLFSRHLNRIPRTGHKNLQIWRAQISDALAHEKGHPRPRFESFGVKRGRQWVYRLTDFGKGVMEAMGGVNQICEDLLKNNEMNGGGSGCGADGENGGHGGAGAGLGQGNGYGYSYCPDAPSQAKTADISPSSPASDDKSSVLSSEESAENVAASNAIANAMAAMAAGLAAMTAAEDEKSAVTAAAAAALVASLTTSVDVQTQHVDDGTEKVEPELKQKAGKAAIRSARKVKA